MRTFLLESFPRSPIPGDWSAYIQRGATLQTHRCLGTVSRAGALAAAAQAVNVLCAAPFPIGDNCTLDQLAFNVTVIGGGGSVARVGLYRATSKKNIYPGALVVDGGEQVTTSLNRKAAAVAANLKPGLYWAVYLCGVAAPTVNTWNTFNNPILGDDSAAPPGMRARITVAQAYGALPATFPAGAAFDANAMISIWGRFSA